MSVQIVVPIIAVKPNQWVKEKDRMLFYSCIEDGEALCLNKTGGTVYLDLKTRVTVSKSFNKGNNNG